MRSTLSLSFVLLLLFLTSLLFMVVVRGERPSLIKLGLVQPFDGALGYEQTAAAAVLAINAAHSRGLLEGTRVE